MTCCPVRTRWAPIIGMMLTGALRRRNAGAWPCALIGIGRKGATRRELAVADVAVRPCGASRPWRQRVGTPWSPLALGGRLKIGAPATCSVVQECEAGVVQSRAVVCGVCGDARAVLMRGLFSPLLQRGYMVVAIGSWHRLLFWRRAFDALMRRAGHGDGDVAHDVRNFSLSY